MITFNLENKITWEELSPSLQELFKSLQSQTSILNNNLNTEIQNRKNADNDIIKEFRPTINNIKNTLSSGSNGQVIKVNKNSSTPVLSLDDEVHFLYAVNSQAELNNALSSAPPSSLADKRIYDLANDDIYSYNGSSWVRDASTSPAKLIQQKVLVYNPATKKLYFYDKANGSKTLNIIPPISNEKPPSWPPNRKYGNKGLSSMVNRLDKENNTTFWEDYFFIGRVVSGNSSSAGTSELNYEKSLGIDLKEVFNKWKRVSSRGSRATQDLDADAGDRNAYGYIDKYATIYDSHNADVTTAFISNSIYSNNYTITLKITRDSTIYSEAHITPDDDDDALFFIAGWMVDGSGMYHDISVVRTGGQEGQWANYQFFICYDALHNVNFLKGEGDHPNLTPHVLTSLSVPKHRWDAGNCYLKVTKTDGKLEAWTSDITNSVTGIDTSKHIVYTLPSSKPSGMANDKWSNIVTMMTSNSKIGFGNCSNAGAFMVTEQEYLFRDEIYDLDSDTIWKYSNGTWSTQGNISDAIPPRSLLYNQRLKKMYWYEGPGNFEEITLGASTNDFTSILNRLTTLENNSSTSTTNITNINNNVMDPIAKGLSGQVMKINDTKDGLVADDDFRIVHFVTTTDELNLEKKRAPVDLAEVFNKWTRFAHYDANAVASRLDHTDSPDVPTGQNLAAYNGRYNWEFDAATKAIKQTVDNCVIAGFVSPTDYYTNYMLRVKANCGWDDDNIMLICGYMKDSSGVEHTLMIVRGAGLSRSTPAYPNNFNESIADTFFWWGLIYDMGNPTQHVIINYNNKVGIQGTQGNKACSCYMTLIRQDHTIIGKTSDFDPAGRDLGDRDDLTFTWTYPDTKPSDMTQAEYDNIGVMLNQTNRVGFGVRSGQPTFSIDKQQEVFEDNDIYDLSTNIVWTYDSSSKTWVKSGKVSESIPNRTFLYNPDRKKFYFYHYWGKYTNITL